jgi:hypothetical protein
VPGVKRNCSWGKKGAIISFQGVLREGFHGM